MDDLDLIWEEAGLPSTPLPPRLRQAYGGDLALGPDAFYANFVTSLDGVVALEADAPSAGPTISGQSREDRVVMGILRAFADAVIVGAGTVRAESGHLWTPGHVFPELAGEYARMRHELGRAGEPLLAVISAAGALNPEDRALQAGALVLTTEAGRSRLGNRLPGTCEVVSMGDGLVSPLRALELLRSRGLRAILTEGGPHLMGSVFAEGVLDDLFLTMSPVLAGRGEDRRLGLIEGLALLPDMKVQGRLKSVRRAGSHLFCQYGLR